ncbi:TetR/AcrR family transcriptional regulator [Amycolatopsis sp. CA-230715]|uniref:TetR/AcrR family transcriptional regulator n=1 Tax=Amycolatopsis sp. CA-230715 TaxID=2745196 RepID=UPI001C00CE4C|nr:TetR/AcrR family transcriptional regulator [Amycolatopsis sp. CA-230715]QWF76869.1 putative HTH-type transcriptional regulator [Amycolatopsis sp. CA-230715]
MSASPRPDGRTTRWAGQRERRRTEFVDAALAAIADHGPEVSTEQIADRAGVARTRLYKHFADAADLQGAIAAKARELIIAELEPVWNPKGSPLEMITVAVEEHLRWLTEHANLYRYLTRHACDETTPDVAAALGTHLTALFAGYLHAFGIDPAPAETTAFGVVGYVESATRQWLTRLDAPGETAVSRERLTELLAGAIWAVLDHTLRAGGVTLDPHARLAPPEDLRRSR